VPTKYQQTPELLSRRISKHRFLSLPISNAVAAFPPLGGVELDVETLERQKYSNIEKTLLFSPFFLFLKTLQKAPENVAFIRELPYTLRITLEISLEMGFE
jgi:hypothetical protein